MEPDATRRYTPEEWLEGFHMSARLFTDAVDMLTADPETTCERMGDYNTAWELKDDIAGEGNNLVRNWSERLSAEQVAAVLALVAAVEKVPASNLPAGSGREVNLSAMQHESWVPLRKQAADLNNLLRPIREQPEQYFRET